MRAAERLVVLVVGIGPAVGYTEITQANIRREILNIYGAFPWSCADPSWTNFTQFCTSTPSTSSATYGPISEWNTASISNFNSIFASSEPGRLCAINVDVSKWNTASVTSMNYFTQGANAFNADVSEWNVASVKDFSNAFTGQWGQGEACTTCPLAHLFNVNIGKWNVASATNMQYMFYHYSEPNMFNQNIGSWNVARVVSFEFMFACLNGYTCNAPKSAPSGQACPMCSNPTQCFNRDIASWNTASVTSLSGIFGSNKIFNQDISKWDVSRVTAGYSLYYGTETSDIDAATKQKIYCAWGTAFRTQNPSWGSPSVCFAATSFLPLNTQVSGGSTLTIFGSAFGGSGAVDMTPSAYVSGQACTTTSWTTATWLVCAAQAPLLAAGALVPPLSQFLAVPTRIALCRCRPRGLGQGRHVHHEPRLLIRRYFAPCVRH